MKGHGKVLKVDALKILGLCSDASFEQAKKAFRRQAMKWHPDRNAAPGAEEKFVEIQASFKSLQEIKESGDWSASWHMQGQSVPNDSPSPSSPSVSRFQTPTSERKKWDPPSGRMFDMGEESGSPVTVSLAFWSSFMSIAEECLSTGASPRMSAQILARGFHGAMTEMCIEQGLLPMMRLHFLREFWVRRRADLFETMERTRDRAFDLGWAGSVASVMNPLCTTHSWEGESFFILDAIGRAFPKGRASGQDLAFYKTAMALMPDVFGKLPAYEKAARLALRVCGWNSGELLMERALASSPEVVELWAAQGVPAQWGAPSDWLGRALSLGVDTGAVLHWMHAEPLKKLCARVPDLPTKLRCEVGRVAELMMESEGQWRFAGTWAGEHEQALGAAQRKMDEIARALKRGNVGNMGVALGFSGLSLSAKAQRQVIYGPAEKVEEALVDAKTHRRLTSSMTVQGVPLAVACAMRAFFEPTSSFDFYTRAKAIEKVAGAEQLARVDARGRNAVDWFEQAILRRANLGMDDPP